MSNRTHNHNLNSTTLNKYIELVGNKDIQAFGVQSFAPNDHSKYVHEQKAIHDEHLNIILSIPLTDEIKEDLKRNNLLPIQQQLRKKKKTTKKTTKKKIQKKKKKDDDDDEEEEEEEEEEEKVKRTRKPSVAEAMTQYIETPTFDPNVIYHCHIRWLEMVQKYPKLMDVTLKTFINIIKTNCLVRIFDKKGNIDYKATGIGKCQ